MQGILLLVFMYFTSIISAQDDVMSNNASVPTDTFSYEPLSSVPLEDVVESITTSVEQSLEKQKGFKKSTLAIIVGVVAIVAVIAGYLYKREPTKPGVIDPTKPKLPDPLEPEDPELAQFKETRGLLLNTMKVCHPMASMALTSPAEIEEEVEKRTKAWIEAFTQKCQASIEKAVEGKSAQEAAEIRAQKEASFQQDILPRLQYGDHTLVDYARESFMTFLSYVEKQYGVEFPECRQTILGLRWVKTIPQGIDVEKLLAPGSSIADHYGQYTIRQVQYYVKHILSLFQYHQPRVAKILSDVKAFDSQ